MPGYMEAPDTVAVSTADAWFARSIATAAQIVRYVVPYACEAYDLLVIPNALQTAGPAVLALGKIPLGGTQQSNLATVTMSATAAANSIWRNRLWENQKAVKYNIGDSITVNVNVIGSGTVNVIVMVRRSPQPAPVASALYNEVTS